MNEIEQNKIESQKTPTKYVRGQFDGIKFLWNIPEIRYFLILMTMLLVSIVVFNIILIALYQSLGAMNLTVIRIEVYGDFVLLGLFLYLMIDLFFFYKTATSSKEFPEKNQYLKMKFLSLIEEMNYQKLKKKRSILLIIVIVFIIVLALFLLVFPQSEFFTYFGIFLLSIYVILYFSAFVIVGILAFMATRGTMESYEDKYSEKIHRKWYWTVLLLPIPWIIFLIFFFTFSYIRMLDTAASFTIYAAIFIYVILGILGLIVLLKKNWRTGYTVSQVSASFTVVFAIMIPFFVGLVVDIMGPIISFIALIYLFIQGTLNDTGNELKGYYLAWDNKLQNFNIKSEQDLSSRNYEEFKSTPLKTDVPNAVKDLALGLIILTYNLFVYLYLVMKIFLLSGEAGITFIEIILYFISIVETIAIICAIILFTFIIIKRQAKKLFGEEPKANEKKPIKTKDKPQKIQYTEFLTCPKCGRNVKRAKFCENCGAQLTVECPHCKKLVKPGNFCEICGKQL
ncbi:MAG: zinc ribbon domain-containing protein [Candidatus Hermodarchaeota archaeon]